MTKPSTKTRVRVSFWLAQDTIRLLDRAAGKSQRSRFIEEAIRVHAMTDHRSMLAVLIKEGAKVRAGRDVALAEDWLELENGADRRARR